MRDLNPHSSGYEPPALTVKLMARIKREIPGGDFRSQSVAKTGSLAHAAKITASKRKFLSRLWLGEAVMRRKTKYTPQLKDDCLSATVPNGSRYFCTILSVKAATSEAFNNASKNVHPDLDLPSSVLGGRPSADGPAGPFRLLYNQHIYFATRRNTVQKNFMLRIVHPCCNPTSVRSARWASGTAPGGGPCKPIRF